MFRKSNSSFPYSQSISYELNPIAPSKPTAKKSFISEIYYNPRLEGKIVSIEPHSRVDLSYWNLIDQDLLVITKRIVINKQCTELNLCGNKITAQGALILALKLFNNSTLKVLDLSYNSIGDGGVHSISQILSPNHYSSVTILSLNKNGISNEGVQYLAEVLQTNQALRELALADNEVGDGGVKELANVLIYRNRTLKVLLLSCNVFITDLSVDYLLQMLEYNQILERLAINNCNLSQAGRSSLRENAKRKANFHLLT